MVGRDQPLGTGRTHRRIGAVVTVCAAFALRGCGGEETGEETANDGAVGVVADASSENRLADRVAEGGDVDSDVFADRRNETSLPLDCGQESDAATAAGSVDGLLGSACSTNADCEAGLECITADSGAFGREGPAGGYCTKQCTNGADCAMLGERAICMFFETSASGPGYCLEGCAVGPPTQLSFDPNKCHGRADVACTPNFWDNGDMCATDQDCFPGWRPVCATMCGWVACLPRCSSDADCGPCLYCNHATGRCSSTPRTGLPLGTPCDLLKDQCIGECGLRCVQNCTIGAAGSCDGAGPAAPDGGAYRYFCFPDDLPVTVGSGTGFGDEGDCRILCDCNSDCQDPSRICREVTDEWIAQATGRRGYCDVPRTVDGGLEAGIVTCP